MQSELITEAARGSEEACRDLFGQWYPTAYRIAKSICGCRLYAEDAVQEALIRLWKALPRLKEPATADRYFYRTVANEARRISAGSRKTRSGLRADTAESIAASPVPEDDHRELAEALATAVDALPEKLRVAVRLHYYGGFTEQETAEILGISLSSVKMRLLRGRQKLKVSLERMGYEVSGG